MRVQSGEKSLSLRRVVVRPIWLGQHVINHVSATGVQLSQRLIQVGVLSGHASA